MKKIIFTISLFLISTTFSFAQNLFDISGQIRPRMQVQNKGFNSELGSIYFNELRTRLGVKFSPIENVNGFIQFQDSRIFGTEPSTLSSTDNIDLHQAYFTINKLFNLPFNLKLGRFEMSYGPQRLIGAVGWHSVGRSFDGGVLQLNTKKVDIDFFSAKTIENFFPDDSLDMNLAGAYANLKIVKNYKIQPFVIGELITKNNFERYTIGMYITGNVGNLSHEFEGAYQLGSQSKNVDIEAFMFALNARYKINSPFKPVIGAGIDYLSGDDGEDAKKYKVFNTLYATNHKYYGYMDYFLNIPNNTYGKGLVDIHGKIQISPCKKIKTALAFHMFNSSVDYTLGNGNKTTEFGSEIDLTVILQYNKAVKFQGGVSLFSPGEIFKERRGKDSSTWGYLMAIVNL